MSVSEISQMKLASIIETTFGVQVTGANLQTLRVTGEGLKQNTESTQSNEIVAGRQIAGHIRTKVNVSGNIDFELSYGSFDHFFAAALMAANTRAQGTLTIDTLPSDGDTITIGATTYRFKTTIALANDIPIESADLPGTLANLVATVNGTGTAGTNYYTGSTSPNASARMTAFSSDESVLTAVTYGLAGNSVATTETFAEETNVFDGTTLGTTTAGEGWTAPVTISPATLSAASSDNSFNDSGNGFGSLVAGQWIKTAGFTNAANNGFFKISTATAAKIVVTGGTLVTEGAEAGHSIKQGSSIYNGTTKTSFNIERTYTDLTTQLALYVGCMVNQITFTVGTNGIITGSMDILGRIETTKTASGGSGYDAVNTNEILNSIDHVFGIYENMSKESVSCMNFVLTINNNLRERMKIGTLGAFSLGSGQCNVTGSFDAYYESNTLYDKYLNWTTTSLAKVFKDTVGNAYVFDIPSAKITDGSRNSSSGKDADFMIPCTFGAFKDATEAITIKIVKFAA